MATLLVCKPEVLMRLADRHHRGLGFILSLSRHENADVQCKSNKNANGLKRLKQKDPRWIGFRTRCRLLRWLWALGREVALETQADFHIALINRARSCAAVAFG